MRKHLSLSLCFLLGISLALISWGVTGHRTIGKIAENHLSPKAKAAVRELLGTETLAQASTWPDEVRSQPDYKHTAPWHYINLPLGLSYPQFAEKVQGMQQENVFSAVKQQTQVLQSSTSSREEKIEALKYIVHFVGDLHQPMHVSREEDKGGNSIQLSYNGNGTNLHALWDSKLIDHEGLTFEQMAVQYDQATPAQIKQWQSDPLMQWIYESYQVSSRLYAEIDSLNGGHSIDDSYYQSHIGIIRDRIEKAGIRLAGLLNSIFQNGLAASGPSKASSTAVIGMVAANPSDNQSPKTINVQDAAQHYNEYVQVCARVFGYKTLDNLTLVNLGAAYPDQPLTVVLRGDALNAYQGIDGQTICVTGKVVAYKEKPEIVVTDPKMIVASKQ